LAIALKLLGYIHAQLRMTWHRGSNAGHGEAGACRVWACLVEKAADTGIALVYEEGEKSKWYRRISTLQEYVLIDAEQISIDCYRRKASGTWELSPVPSDASIPESPDTEAL